MSWYFAYGSNMDAVRLFAGRLQPADVAAGERIAGLMSCRSADLQVRSCRHTNNEDADLEVRAPARHQQRPA
jgi:hypothetical protein